MDVIHAQEVQIARGRARVLRGVESLMMGTGITSGLNVDQVFRYAEELKRYAEELERLKARRNRLASLRASITHETHNSAVHATEGAILDQLTILESSSAATDHQQEEAAPEIAGLKRVAITKLGGEGGGGEIDVCAICHEQWKIGDDVRSVLGCSHAYHYNCISKWMKRKPTCPMCRYEIPTNTNNNKRRKTSTTA